MKSPGSKTPSRIPISPIASEVSDHDVVLLDERVAFFCFELVYAFYNWKKIVP